MDLQGLLELETAVWEALVDGDAEADAQLLTEDFLGVYPNGFAGRDDHAGQLAGGPTVQRFAVSDARLVVVSDTAVLLVYRATYERPARREGEQPVEESMYVSSLWCERDGTWRNVFSQDTPATGASVG
jgi:hypothetical protein